MAPNGEVEGRTEAPAGRRGRTLSPGARGAKQEALHGPLERLLEGSIEGVERPFAVDAGVSLSRPIVATL